MFLYNPSVLPKKLKYERSGGFGKKEKRKEIASLPFAVFISVALFISGAFALTIAYNLLGKEISLLSASVFSLTWSKAEGEVIKTFTSTETGYTKTKGFSRKYTYYVAHVIYLFRAAVAEYQSETIDFYGSKTLFSRKN